MRHWQTARSRLDMPASGSAFSHSSVDFRGFAFGVLNVRPDYVDESERLDPSGSARGLSFMSDLSCGSSSAELLPSWSRLVSGMASDAFYRMLRSSRVASDV